MKGTKEDWENLRHKINALRNTLKPIEDAIGLGKSCCWKGFYTSWWDNVDEIASKLLDTFNGNPDADWWGRIIYEWET